MNARRRSLKICFTPIIAVILVAAAVDAAPSQNKTAAKAKAKSVDADKVRFFENKVRPILVRRCYSCHGPKQQKSGLRLDSRSGMMRGGESGAVIVPGHPDESRVIEVIRHSDDDIKMPPKAKLPAKQIEVLIRWIRSGAVWPNSPKTAVATVPSRFNFEELREKHWAFRPVTRPGIPAVKNQQWAQTAIDRFVLARLESAGLPPSPRADRRTWIRRVTFALRGMPPTMAEVDAFLHDTSPGAAARVVDRLLASPQYGERWGRHWLDVARYADTKGYIFNQETRYPYAYTYRDYVIRVFNEDLPYDRFLMEQIAADQLPGAKRPQALAAMGFLTVGRRLFNNPHDIIDDRIDVVGRGLLGLTVGCARCHDHKYDPIPMADYYSLYGIFASSQEPSELPVLGRPTDAAAYQKFLKEHKQREQAYRKKLNQGYQELRDQLRSQIESYLLAVLNRPGINEKAMLVFQQGDLRPRFVIRWRRYLQAAARRNDPVFTLWHQLTALPAGRFAEQAKQIIDRHRAAAVAEKTGASKQRINRWVLAAFALHPPKSLTDVAGTYGQLLRDSDQSRQTLIKRYRVDNLKSRAGTTTTNAGRPAKKSDAELLAVRNVLSGPGSPITLSQNDIPLFNRKTQGEVRALKKKLDSLPITSAGAPPRAMVMVDRPRPFNPRIFIRGNPARRGRAVPRAFLEILSGPQHRPFQIGSGRLELARAIADPHNPLTARVLVNRVWMHLFGQGLVRTPSDFGMQADPPTHPQLLDYLAWKFVTGGWSIKRLHREILLSAVYQQTSTIVESQARAARVDPNNRLLWRMNRRRLEFETLRDSILFVSGRLDERMAGRSVNIEARPFSGRRTVYAFVNRNDLPNLFRTFDFPSPDASASARPVTTVPQQALFEMNSPFILDQAQLLASAGDVRSASGPTQKIRALYRRVLARDPDQMEQAALLNYVKQIQQQESTTRPTKNHPPGVWDRIAQTLLLTNEFLFVD